MLNQKNKAFTLVELMIVVAIIAVIATIITVSYNTARERGNIAAEEMDLTNIGKAIEMYYIETGTFPVETYAEQSHGLTSAEALFGPSYRNWYQNATFPMVPGSKNIPFEYALMNPGDGVYQYALVEDSSPVSPSLVRNLFHTQNSSKGYDAGGNMIIEPHTTYACGSSGDTQPAYLVYFTTLGLVC